MASSTYEVYIEVRHHPRHLDDWEQRQSTAFKLVDTGRPADMVASSLRAFADELERDHFNAAYRDAELQQREDAKARWEARQ